MQVISCPVDYRTWLQTMYSHYGQQLHHGPYWSSSNVHDNSTGRQRIIEQVARYFSFTFHCICMHHVQLADCDQP